MYSEYSEKCKNKKVNSVHDITVYNYTKDDNMNMVWNHFFKLNKKTFKKNKYEFNHMIRTDGISVCVLFVLLENGKPMSKVKGKKLKGFLDSNCPYECNYSYSSGMQYENGHSSFTSSIDKYNTTNNIECINYCRNNYEKIYKISTTITDNNLKCEKCKRMYNNKSYIPINEICPCINNITNIPLSECDKCILNYRGNIQSRNIKLEYICPCITNTSNIIQEIYPINCDIHSYGK